MSDQSNIKPDILSLLQGLQGSQPVQTELTQSSLVPEVSMDLLQTLIKQVQNPQGVSAGT
jgi:hypothetical protein